MNICTLNEDINQCDFFDRETGACHNENPCNMVERKIETNSVKQNERKEKWYDKYYRK